MSETTRMLDDLVAALVAGSEEDLVVALRDAEVDVHVEGDWLTFVGEERRRGAKKLLGGFDDIAVTPVLRRTTASQAVEEAVVSGRHVGRFAGVEPSGERVRVNVSATAVAAGDGSVVRLRLTPDISGLLGEAARPAGSLAEAAAFVAWVRENRARDVVEWEEPDEREPAPAHRRPARTRRRVLVAAVLLVLGVAAAVGWRWLEPQVGRDQGSATVPTTRASSSPLVNPSTPTPTPTPTPTSSEVTVVLPPPWARPAARLA